MLVYIVTYYGCNIKDDECWPETSLFKNYEEAYKYYISATHIFSKSYDESTKKTYTFTNTLYDPKSTGGEYVVIHSRKDVGDEVDCILLARCEMNTL